MLHERLDLLLTAMCRLHQGKGWHSHLRARAPLGCRSGAAQAKLGTRPGRSRSRKSAELDMWVAGGPPWDHAGYAICVCHSAGSAVAPRPPRHWKAERHVRGIPCRRQRPPRRPRPRLIPWEPLVLAEGPRRLALFWAGGWKASELARGGGGGPG